MADDRNTAIRRELESAIDEVEDRHGNFVVGVFVQLGDDWYEWDGGKLARISVAALKRKVLNYSSRELREGRKGRKP